MGLKSGQGSSASGEKPDLISLAGWCTVFVLRFPPPNSGTSLVLVRLGRGCGTWQGWWAVATAV
jgi:hypothetical protein